MFTPRPEQPHPGDLYGGDIKNEKPKGKIRLKGQSRVLKFPKLSLIVSLASEFDLSAIKGLPLFECVHFQLFDGYTVSVFSNNT